MNSELPPSPADAPWEKVAAAARTARQPGDESAPFGFATRVVAALQELRQNERAMIWARWSFRAALCSLGIAALVIALQRPAPRAEALLPVPAYELP